MFYKKPYAFISTRVLLWMTLVVFAGTGCVRINLYNKQVAIPDQQWNYNFSPEFKFDIKDSVSRFLIYVTIRHTDSYQYNNLWLNIGTQAPGDTMITKRINLQLASSEQWEGVGMDDIYEVRKLISNGPVLLSKTGEYTFKISQIMRDDPLKYIMNVGIRLERVNE